MIRFVRSVLSGICFSIFGIGGIIASLTIVPISLIFFNKRLQKQILSDTVHYLWKIFVGLMCAMGLIKIKSQDSHKFKQLRGKIVVANHPSLIDVVILVAKIPHAICVVKGSLFQNPFVKHLIRHVYLSNSMAPNDFMQHAKCDLDNGYNIIIFPEGTRTTNKKNIRLHRGFAHLCLFSEHDIQPIRISNSPHILGKGQPWWDVGDKTSVYTLKLLPTIKFDNTSAQSEHAKSITITEATKKALFS